MKSSICVSVTFSCNFSLILLRYKVIFLSGLLAEKKKLSSLLLILFSDAKLLGVTISSDLSWNAHITEVIKKAAKRLYFLIQLKRARVSQKDLCLFYVTCVRSVIDYAAPVFHYSLPAYLTHEVERVQRRAMRIASVPALSISML